MLARLATLRPDDYTYNFKAAAAALWSSATPPPAAVGTWPPTAFAARAAAACPAYWAAHCVHARLLTKVGRWAEAEQVVRDKIVGGAAGATFQFNRAPPRGEWEFKLVYDAIRIIPEVQTRLHGRSRGGGVGGEGGSAAAEALALQARFEAAFPRSAVPIPTLEQPQHQHQHQQQQQQHQQQEQHHLPQQQQHVYKQAPVEPVESVQEGFVRGLQLLGNATKTDADWAEARRLAERAAASAPAVFWYQLTAGICCTFAPKAGPAGAVAGQHYAEAAVAIASTEPKYGPPLAYALLARSLTNAGGGGNGDGNANDAVYAAAAAVVRHPGSGALDHTDESEHAWLLLDAVRVVRQWSRSIKPRFAPTSAKSNAVLATYTADFSTVFPGLRVGAARVAKEEDGCVIS